MRLSLQPLRLHRLTVVCLAFFLLSSTGCLTFDQQTFVILAPEKGTEAKALLVYEGFHVGGGGKPETDLNKAKSQLSTLAKGQSFFYMGDPILALDIAEQTSDSALAKQRKAFLRKQVQVSELTFFDNKDGKLSGFQILTFPNTPEFLAEINRWISQEILRSTSDNPSPSIDAETADLLVKAARNNHVWLTLTPGRLSFATPGSAAMIQQVKRSILGIPELEKAVASQGKNEPQTQPSSRLGEVLSVAKALSDNSLSWQHSKNRVTLSIGVGDGEPIQLAFPERESVSFNVDQDKKLYEFAKSLKARSLGKTTTQKVIQEFVGKE